MVTGSAGDANKTIKGQGVSLLKFIETVDRVVAVGGENEREDKERGTQRYNVILTY